MLVLKRRCGEKLRIGRDGEIVIEVLEIMSGRVRLGISAPPDVDVDREEVFELKQQRRQEDEESEA